MEVERLMVAEWAKNSNSSAHTTKKEREDVSMQTKACM